MPDNVELRGLVLSAVELRTLTDWPEAVVEDYLNLIDNIIQIGDVVNTLPAGDKVEDIPTDFADNRVVYAKNGFLQQDEDFQWDNTTNTLLIDGFLNMQGDIKGKNRVKQYFFTGF